MKTTIFLVITCIQFSTYFCEHNYDIEFAWAQGIPGEKDTECNYDRIRIIREYDANLGVYTFYLNGTFSFSKDFGNDYTCGFTSGHSASRVGFTPWPYKNQSPCCEFFKNIYGKYGQPMFHGKSNFPIITADGPCPIPKGDYYVYKAKAKDMQKYLPGGLREGFWKIDTVFMNPLKEVVGGLRIVFISNKKLYVQKS